MDERERIRAILDGVDSAIEALGGTDFNSRGAVLPGGAQDAIRTHLEMAQSEATEALFLHFLRIEAQKPDGFVLVDDGSIDTVLGCPKCDGWLRFDGRDAAISFLEDEGECWLCDSDESEE